MSRPANSTRGPPPTKSWETLRTLSIASEGVTIILVTHEADIAAYADRVVTMRDGVIVGDERVSKRAPAAIAEATRAAFRPTTSGQVLPTAGFLPFTFMVLIAASQAGFDDARRVYRRRRVDCHGCRAPARARRCASRSKSLSTNVVVILLGALTTGGISWRWFGSASTLTVADALRHSPRRSRVVGAGRLPHPPERGKCSTRTRIGRL